MSPYFLKSRYFCSKKEVKGVVFNVFNTFPIKIMNTLHRAQCFNKNKKSGWFSIVCMFLSFVCVTQNLVFLVLFDMILPSFFSPYPSFLVYIGEKSIILSLPRAMSASRLLTCVYIMQFYYLSVKLSSVRMLDFSIVCFFYLWTMLGSIMESWTLLRLTMIF